jgi:ABC-type multidrug transport system fused ATPase/permease subunit
MRKLWQWLSRPSRYERLQADALAQLSAMKDELASLQGTVKSNQAELTQIHDQKEREARRSSNWNLADRIASFAILIVATVAALVLRYVPVKYILEHSGEIIKYMAFGSIVFAIISAAFMFVTERMYRAVAALTVVSAALTLCTLIYNPDSPEFHKYWDGEEKIVCVKVKGGRADSIESASGGKEFIVHCTPEQSLDIKLP